MASPKIDIHLVRGVQAEQGRRSFAKYIRLCWPQVESNQLDWNWHMDAMAEFCMGLYYGQFKSGLILVPPGMTKSLTVSTLFPSWVWVQDPSQRFIYATYAQDLSEKNAKLMRDLVMCDFHRNRWPHVEISKFSSTRVRNFETTAKGWRFSSSVGGQMTGRHGNYLVFDDLVKAQDAEGRNAHDSNGIMRANDFWFKTMQTRRADPKETRRLGIMQRLHFEDTAQKCIDTGEYEVLKLPMRYDPTTHCYIKLEEVPEIRGTKQNKTYYRPAIPGRVIEDKRRLEGELLHPGRFPEEVVETDRKVLGSLTFEAQMQQNPAPTSGNIFKIDWFKRWEKLPKGMRKIITVDCAFKDNKSSDYVAIQCWGIKSQNYYLIDQIYGRFNVLGTCDQIDIMRSRHKTAVGTHIEDKANGPAVMQIMKGHASGINAWPRKGSGMTAMSKVSRAEAVAAVFESGNVFVPSDANAPWIGEYITELTRFPLVTNDDRTDATTMALLILHQPRNRRYRDAIAQMRNK